MSINGFFFTFQKKDFKTFYSSNLSISKKFIKFKKINYAFFHNYYALRY